MNISADQAIQQVGVFVARRMLPSVDSAGMVDDALLSRELVCEVGAYRHSKAHMLEVPDDAFKSWRIWVQYGL